MLIGSLLRLSIIVDGKESLDSGYRWWGAFHPGSLRGCSRTAQGQGLADAHCKRDARVSEERLEGVVHTWQDPKWARFCLVRVTEGSNSREYV